MVEVIWSTNLIKIISLAPFYWNGSAWEIWRNPIMGHMWVTLRHEYIMIWKICFSANWIARSMESNLVTFSYFLQSPLSLDGTWVFFHSEVMPLFFLAGRRGICVLRAHSSFFFNFVSLGSEKGVQDVQCHVGYVKNTAGFQAGCKH